MRQRATKRTWWMILTATARPVARSTPAWTVQYDPEPIAPPIAYRCAKSSGGRGGSMCPSVVGRLALTPRAGAAPGADDASVTPDSVIGVVAAVPAPSLQPADRRYDRLHSARDRVAETTEDPSAAALRAK
jgi:hypothetical protein